MLTVVGTGYALAGHVTPETRTALASADHLFYLVTDPATGPWLEGLNPGAESLHTSYREGEDGLAASWRMVERILTPLRLCRSVCAAFYGHPAVFMHTSHQALRQARQEGFPAVMLPAVSAEDCLIADLGVDPAATGRFLYEATDFLLRPRMFDPSSALVLLQVGVIGRAAYRPGGEPDRRGLAVLTEVLRETYPSDHEVVLYEASPLPLFEPRIHRLPLADLPEAPVTVASTLYVPPWGVARANPEVRARLGLAPPPSSRRQ